MRTARTHLRIKKAAYEAFCERGYAGTTMAHVAERAGVAVQTVYFVFHTKAELLSHSYDYAVGGEPEPIVPEAQPFYREMVAATDVVVGLRHFAAGAGEITRRVAPLYVVSRGAALGDPEVARVHSFHEDWRADGYREVLAILRKKALLRPNVSPERAVQLLLMYVGPDVYDALVRAHGWTHDEWLDWTVDTLAEQLFGQPPA
jgi:AcrR family transcriptional regulator